MIYKYKIEYGTNILELPVNSNVMSAGITNGELVVWVDATASNELEFHNITVVYTGEEVPENSTFIGTIVAQELHNVMGITMLRSGLVYHVFESNV